MQNEQTNKTDTAGTENNKAVAEPVKSVSELEKLKANNKEMEEALIKGRELRAEAQRLEADKMLGGEAGGHIEMRTPEQRSADKAQSMADEISGAFK